MAYNILSILIDLVITFFAYMSLPFLTFSKKNQNWTKKEIKIINIINSIIFSIFFYALRLLLKIDTTSWNIAPAVFYYFLNNYIWLNRVKNKKSLTANTNKTQIKKKTSKIIKTDYKKIMIITLIILFVMSLSLNFYLLHKNKNIEQDYSEVSDKYIKTQIKYNNTNDVLNELLDGYTSIYVKRKLDFFDENIVFVIDGYGNYFSNYDCMIQRVGNSSYNYWAFNKEAAIDYGYKNYQCN